MFTQQIGLAQQISIFGPDYTATVSVHRLQKRLQQAHFTSLLRSSSQLQLQEQPYFFCPPTTYLVHVQNLAHRTERC